MKSALVAVVAMLATLLSGAAHAAPEPRTLIVGDSIAWGYSASIKSSGPVVNRSIPGSCLFLTGSSCPNPETATLIQRLRQAGVRSGDTVVISIGTNDLQNGLARQYVKSYREAVRYVRARDATVLVATITPFGGELLWGRAEMNMRRLKVNGWIARHVPSIDLSAAVGGERMSGSLDSGDGLHPNPTGSDRLARAVSAALRSQQGPLRTCAAPC